MNDGMRRPTQVSLPIAACCALACAQEPELCDGSDDVRWAAHENFGAREWVPRFVAEYGQRSISIDGHCRFWLYDESPRGLRRGAIGSQLASDIAYWSRFGSYARFADPSGSNICLDGGGAWISDGTATLDAECVSLEAPSGWREAVASVDYVARELDAIAEYVWRPVQILPLAEPSILRNQPVYDWNAPFDLAAQAVTGDDPRLDRDTTGIPVDDPAVLERLDELRALDIAAEDAASRPRYVERGLFVRDGEDRIFQLFIRDEQPDGLFAAPTRR